MVVVPIKLAPGMRRNGTPYSNGPSWQDGNLVRWQGAVAEPVGGWTRRYSATSVVIPPLVSDPLTEVVRDIFSWRALDSTRHTIFGSNSALYHMNEPGTITNVTPAGASASAKDAIFPSGYGSGPYGIGAFGVESNLGGVDPIPPLRWSIANFGELALALQANDVDGTGLLYEYSPTGGNFTAVANAPTHCQAVVVTGQRQVMVIGANGEARAIAVCEVEDRTDWTPTISNQAVSRTIAGDGRLLAAVNANQGILIIGEADAHLARYIGPPYVYSIDSVGTKCGTIAESSVIATDNFVVWLGRRSFWVYDGSTNPLLSLVSDYILADIDTSQVSKISAFTVSAQQEIWWLYQSTGSATGEPDKYAMWNYAANTWATGSLDRGAALDADPLRNPIMVSSAGEIYNHELLDVMPDDEVFIATGPLDEAHGNRMLALRSVFPDTIYAGDCEIRFTAKDMPTSPERSYGPYPYTNPTPVRVMGREISMRLRLLDTASKIGTMRMDTTVGAGR
jgi:hypothetical protein